MSKPIVRTLPSLFLWQAITIAAGFVTQIILARTLGPHDKGILDFFLLVPFVTSSIAELGLLSANTYFAGKGTFGLQSLHSNSLIWSAGMGVLMFAIGIAISVLGSPFASLTDGFFLLALTAIAPSLYYSLWSGLMYGSDETRMVYRINGIYSLLALSVYALAVTVGLPLEWLLPLSVVLLFVRGGLSLSSIMRSRVMSSLQFDGPALRQSLLYGLALYVGLALNTLHFRVDQFLVEGMLGPTELGNYALAVRIAELLWLLDYVVVTASLYRVTAAGRKEAILATQRLFRLVAVLVALPSLVIGLSAPAFIPFMFGEAFRPAIRALWLLLPGIISWSLARSLSPFISYQYGKPWYNTLSAAVAFAVNMSINLVLIPRFGIAGAAAASSISYTVNFVIIAWMFFHLTKAGFTETFLPRRDDFNIVFTAIREKYVQIIG